MTRIKLSFTAIFLVVLSGAISTGADRKPVLLYSLYFNAPGENRYSPEGTYKEVMTRLRKEFDVRVDDLSLTAQKLADVSVVLVSNPNEKAVGTNPPPHHVSERDIEVLTSFVQKGGGLILMLNQENHNLEIEKVNRLLARFGIQGTNLYTDAKKLPLPKSTPVIGGLRWAYYTGNLLLLDERHPAKPRALVKNDLAHKPLAGPRDQPGVLMAKAELGKGRVVVVTDSGWINNAALREEGIGTVVIRDQDNWEILRRLLRWLARAD